MTTPANKALQKIAGLEHPPTDLTYELRMGVAGEGARAYDWKDKPHRLVYDACREVERLTRLLAAADALAEAGNALSFAAQITGGTAGRDENLVAEIDRYATALTAYQEARDGK